MKKFALCLLALAFFAGCGGGESNETPKDDSNKETEVKKEPEIKEIAEEDIKSYEDEATRKVGLKSGFGKSELIILEAKYDYMDYPTPGELIAVGMGPRKDPKKRYLKQDSAKYGYINFKGEEVVPLNYDDAERPKHGVAKVCVREDEYLRCGLVDREGKERLEPKYSSLYVGNTYGMTTLFDPETRKYGVVDTNFNWVAEPKYDVLDQYYSKSDGLIWFGNGKVSSGRRLRDGKYGYMNLQGEEVIPAQFESVGRFSQGLAAVKKKILGKYGYINTKGEVVIDYKFDYAYEFDDDGTSKVKVKDREFKIDREGNEIKE